MASKEALELIVSLDERASKGLEGVPLKLALTLMSNGQANFDYEALEVETRVVVQQRTNEIKRLAKRAAQDIIDIGQKLIEVKDKLGHGNFGRWLEAEFDWSYPTAARFMQVGAQFKSINLIDSRVAPSALYLLASPSTPVPAFMEAVERAYAGERITHSKALEIVGLHKDTAEKPHVAYNTGDNEWYTPYIYIAGAYSVMGGIDLDPASSELANKTVGAKAFYTAQDDGLAQDWYGRVWMNPPYAAELIGKFCNKLVHHVGEGDIEQAIVLVNNATETGWFQQLLWLCSAVCFPKSRVRFLDTAGNPGAPLQGQAVLYFGPNADLFVSKFAAFGGTQRWAT